MTKRNGSSGDGPDKGGRKDSRKNSGRSQNTGALGRDTGRTQRSRTGRNPSKGAPSAEPLAAKHKRLKPPTRPKPANGAGERSYTVGYSKPPVEHRWKPGFCPNPAGRKKGSKSEATILNEILFQKIPMPFRGKMKMVTIMERIYWSIAQDALKGNIRSAGFLLSRHLKLGSEDKANAALSDDERTILLDYLRRLKDEPEDGE